MGFFKKLAEGLKKTRDNMIKGADSLFKSRGKIDDELFEELEEILIMSDVGGQTSAQICANLRKRVKENRVTDAEAVRDLLKQELAERLGGGEELNISTQPSVILVIGVNGAGKTTTIGKIAYNLKSRGKKVLLGAADTFRAAAVGQLEIWAERAGVPLIKHGEGTDPAAVVYDTIAAGKARGVDVIICDTAGRLHNKKNLMNELSKISRIISRELPGCDRETLLVMDATTGQNALSQAREFKEAADITGIVLTKLDGTARGGVIIGIKNELNVPVKYIGVGEKLDDLQPFNAAEFIEALFGGGNARASNYVPRAGEEDDE
ncbi:MAG: signal recognition particle-docking protein FtsY [Oscillospiraceae bacterium]|jgi:fused signal recognition particle receptor|nr:signal recognition particle-docking protein FtsY [Oscillospiraceae bacterium]